MWDLLGAFLKFSSRFSLGRLTNPTITSAAQSNARIMVYDNSTLVLIVSFLGYNRCSSRIFCYCFILTIGWCDETNNAASYFFIFSHYTFSPLSFNLFFVLVFASNSVALFIIHSLFLWSYFVIAIIVVLCNNHEVGSIFFVSIILFPVPSDYKIVFKCFLPLPFNPRFCFVYLIKSNRDGTSPHIEETHFPFIVRGILKSYFLVFYLLCLTTR